MIDHLKVVQVSAFFPSQGGGIEVVAHQLSKELSNRQHEVVHVAGNLLERDRHISQKKYCQMGARAIDLLGRFFGIPLPIWGVSSLRMLWHVIRKNDIVHVHDYLYFPCLMAFIFARLQRKNVVITQHIGCIPFDAKWKGSLLSAINRYIGVFVLKRCDAVVFVSDVVRQYFSKIYSGFSGAHVIQNGVDADIYKPAAHFLPKPHLSFLFVGRFVEKKGIQLLRQCVNLNGVSWTFVGEGPLSPVSWSELPSSARVLAGLRGEDIVPLYQQADLLVLPSIGEGFPLVVQEALSCGTPVLVSAEVRQGFEVVDDACVFVINAESHGQAFIVALQQQLQFLAAHPEKLGSARSKAYLLSGQWSWKKTVDQYELIYMRLIE